MSAITGDPVLCILFAAIVTWVVHSSVASVLLVMSLAYAHFVTPSAALALVLGANLGSATKPIVEGARRDDPASYRLPLPMLCVSEWLRGQVGRPDADVVGQGINVAVFHPRGCDRARARADDFSCRRFDGDGSAARTRGELGPDVAAVPQARRRRRKSRRIR